MDKVVNFQISLFGSFINIQPNQEITMRLVSMLTEENMFPGTATVSSVDPVQKKVETETRLQMVSQDKTWKIVFFQERIDFVYNYLGGGEYYTDLNEIFEKGVNLINRTFSCFSDTTGNRLAVNGTVILPEMTNEETDMFINRFTAQVSPFKNKHFDEWNVRYNIRKQLPVSEDKNEECNNIINMGNVVGLNTQTGEHLRRMSIGIDINTVPEHVGNRFKYENLLYFAKNAKKEMQDIIAAIEGE